MEYIVDISGLKSYYPINLDFSNIRLWHSMKKLWWVQQGLRKVT